MDGVEVPWGGVALLPFVDERRLLAEVRAERPARSER